MRRKIKSATSVAELFIQAALAGWYAITALALVFLGSLITCKAYALIFMLVSAILYNKRKYERESFALICVTVGS